MSENSTKIVIQRWHKREKVWKDHHWLGNFTEVSAKKWVEERMRDEKAMLNNRQFTPTDRARWERTHVFEYRVVRIEKIITVID